MSIDTIYNMDCLEGMRQMEDNSVDAVITSPPYNFGLRNKLYFKQLIEYGTNYSNS